MRFEISVIVHIAAAIVEAASLHLLYTSFLGRRAQSIYAYIGVSVLYVGLSLLPPLLAQNILLTGTVTVISSLAVAVALYSGSPLNKLITAGICVAYRYISEPLSAAVIMWVSGHIFPELPNNDAFYFIGVGLSTFIHFAIIFVLSFRRKPRSTRVKLRYQALLLAMIVLCCFLAYADMIFIVRSGLEMSALQLFTEIALGVMSVFVYYMFEKLQENAEREMAAIMLENQMKQIRRQFEIIEMRDEEIRILKHDLNNQLVALRHISENDDRPELATLAANLTGYIENATRQSVTGVPVIDAIIEIKKMKAEQQNTEFTVKANDAKKIVINPIHLNIVIGNALDNALEACSRLPKGKRRYIELALKTDGDFLYIRVTNSAPPVKRRLNGLPVSSKRSGEQNGYGLESIRRMINEYSGIFKIDATENEFILMLRMRNSPPPRETGGFNGALSLEGRD
jgi:sensor histidine kinase YesM